MTERRRSTVFDYSNLRLHSDGTRVYQKSTNLAPRIAKATVRTSRQNWIAKDAGGLSSIRKFKRTKRTLQDIQADEEYIWTENRMPDDDERRVKQKDDRPSKRRRFLEDLDYLNKDRSTSTSLASDTGVESFPYEPSSVRVSFFQHLHINDIFLFYFSNQDLLKCIHRYASEFYTESGQLLNSSRDYRKQRKKTSEEKKGEGRRQRTSSSKRYQDMYKVFDGSAIMAIGQYKTIYKFVVQRFFVSKGC